MNDLNGIYFYIKDVRFSPQSAEAQLARIEQAIDSLNFMPERFRHYDIEPWASRNLRVLPVDHYLIFYVPDTEMRRVTVVRIVYSGRDLPRHRF